MPSGEREGEPSASKLTLPPQIVNRSAHFGVHEMSPDLREKEREIMADCVKDWRADLGSGAQPLRVSVEAIRRAIKRLKLGKGSADGIKADVVRELDDVNLEAMPSALDESFDHSTVSLKKDPKISDALLRWCLFVLLVQSPHIAMLSTLDLTQADSQLKTFIANMLRHSSVWLNLGNVRTSAVPLDRGVPQRAPESPFLFILVTELTPAVQCGLPMTIDC